VLQALDDARAGPAPDRADAGIGVTRGR
jgi:hypothetical protein